MALAPGLSAAGPFGSVGSSPSNPAERRLSPAKRAVARSGAPTHLPCPRLRPTAQRSPDASHGWLFHPGESSHRDQEQAQRIIGAAAQPPQLLYFGFPLQAISLHSTGFPIQVIGSARRIWRVNVSRDLLVAHRGAWQDPRSHGSLPCRETPFVVRATSTEHGAWLSTRPETLPRNRRPSAERFAAPTTIRSAPA